MWDLFVKVVCERESVCVKTQSIKDWSVFVGSSWVNIPRSDACALHMIGMRRVRTGWRQLVFMSISWVRPSHETTARHSVFTRLSFLIHTFCTYTIYTHITHRYWGVLLRENPSHRPWELEIFIPTILYIIVCGFSSTPTSPFPYHWEVDSPNTYHTLLECSVRFWCCWEALEEARHWRMQSGVLWNSES